MLTLPLNELRHIHDAPGSTWASWLGLVLGLCLTGGACTDHTDDRRAPARDEATEAQRLNSLPYVTRTPVRDEHRGRRGVVTYEEDLAHPGLNLYGSLTRQQAYLRSMTGELVHTWHAEGVFSDRKDFPLPPGTLDMTDAPVAPGLTVAEIHDDHLLAIEDLSGLVKLDWDSNVVFALNNNAHHDVDTAEDGSIFVLTARPRRIGTGQGGVVIVDDFIEHLSPGGQLIQEYSIFEMLAESPETQPLIADKLRLAMHWFDHMDRWKRGKIDEKPTAKTAFDDVFQLYDDVFVHETQRLRRAHELYVLFLTPADILHSNTLEILSDRPDGLWRAGQLLVSVRNLDLVVVFDLDTRRVVWSWGPDTLSRQHQPSVLANGNLLIFNNGTAGGRSHIIELDPADKAIIRTHGDTPDTRFFCGAMGGVQGLPNGNALITHSSIGRVYEVDRQGRVVWDFFNPDRGFNPFGESPAEETIEAIYRLERVDARRVAAMEAR